MANGPQQRTAMVQVPAYMLAIAVLLWGWHQSLFIYALVAAIALECARRVHFRWEFDDADFHRLGDVSGVGLLLLVIVQFADRGVTGIYGVLRWFPMALLGLTLAQLYSTRVATPLSAMFPSVRYALKRGRIAESGHLDMRLPFLIACLLSACAGVGRSAWIIPAETALLVWLLWINRPARRGVLSVFAALMLCVVVVLSVIGVASSTRKALGPVIMDILRERMAHWRDPFRNHTALGEIGRLKLSDRIVMRVESPPGIAVPRLLHEATYSQLSNNVWLAGASPFELHTPSAEGTRWDLSADRRPFRTVTVAKNLIRGKAMLAVPAGAFRIEDLPVEELYSNSLGALKVNTGPALVRYRVRYAPGAGLRAAPREHDLVVPRRLNMVLDQTLAELKIVAPLPLPSPAPQVTDAQTSAMAAEQVEATPRDAGERQPLQVLRALHRYFKDNYRYTLELTAPTEELHPLENFLLRSRAGHCEFFATATVLLLRAAGIPARYATGYAVQEYSPLEQAWLVRRRHAHSWAVAWVGEQWVAVDTTPAQWFDEEALGSAWWQSAYDAVSWVWHIFSRWRLERVGDETESKALLWLLVPLGVFLAWRVANSRRVNRSRDAASIVARPSALVPHGADSEFYRIEAMLSERGLQRPRYCPPRVWLRQLAQQGRLPDGAQHWEELVKLHYRLRFAKHGLDAEQRKRLAQGVSRWLQRAG